MPRLTRHEVDFSPELSLAMKVALAGQILAWVGAF